MTTPQTLRILLTAGSLAVLAGVLSGCLVGPNYVRPSAPTPTTFKEAPNPGNGWKPAAQVQALPKGAWWTLFNDDVLNGLEAKVAVNNQNVKEYEAAYRAAKALTAEEKAALFPTVSLTASGTRSGGGSGRSGGSSKLTTTTSGGTVISSSGTAVTTYNPALGASWSPDLWGAIRRQIEADKAAAQYSAAELAYATLSAQAELANDYFILRYLDEQKRLYDKEVQEYKRYLLITQNQYKAGTMAYTNVITTQALLLSAEASDQNVEVQRQQEEHAIALLTGVPPAELTIAPGALNKAIPIAPAQIPSELLERRPDIAAAERTMKEYNALIGVQVAAYYPTITLSGSYGFSASNLGSLFSTANSVWDYGASLSETLLDFGARRARVKVAKAQFDEQVAAYRETVLTAFQGVEDELVALRVYQGEEAVVNEAAAQARKATELYLNQYKAGTVDYTTVISAETTAFSDELQVAALLEERQIASVTLIEDLGGGWSVEDLPKQK